MQISNKINNFINIPKPSVIPDFVDADPTKRDDKLQNANGCKIKQYVNVVQNTKTRQVRILQLTLVGCGQFTKKSIIATQPLKKSEGTPLNTQIFRQINNKVKKQLLQAVKPVQSTLKTTSYFFQKSKSNYINTRIKNRTISPQKNLMIIDQQLQNGGIKLFHRVTKKLQYKCHFNQQQIQTQSPCIEKLNNNFMDDEHIKQISPVESISKSLNLIKKQKKYQTNIITPSNESRSGLTLYNNRATKPKTELLIKTLKNLTSDEEEKKIKLELKKQLQQDYSKPFNPPKNISAQSYLIFQPNFSENKQKDYRYRIHGNSRDERWRNQSMSQSRKKYPYSHKIIAAVNSRNSVQIASLTKIMTCLLTLEICTKFKIQSKQQKIQIGKFQSDIGGTSAQISQGQTYTLQDLYYGLMLPSGNDASVALAVWAGRVLLSHEQPLEMRTHKKKIFYQRFIVEMNNKAVELGMMRTTYANSHGLMNPLNRSCAIDLALLCQHAMNNPKFRQIVSCKSYTNTIQYNQNTSISHPSKIKKQLSTFQKDHEKDDEIQEGQQQDLDSNQQQPQYLPTKQIIISHRIIQWENTHRLIQEKPKQYIGIKTGNTTSAGPCLASCVKAKNGRYFIIIVLNCEKMSMRFKDTERLKKWVYLKEGLIKKIGTGREMSKQPSTAK